MYTHWISQWIQSWHRSSSFQACLFTDIWPPLFQLGKLLCRSIAVVPPAKVLNNCFRWFRCCGCLFIKLTVVPEKWQAIPFPAPALQWNFLEMAGLHQIVSSPVGDWEAGLCDVTKIQLSCRIVLLSSPDLCSVLGFGFSSRNRILAFFHSP